LTVPAGALLATARLLGYATQSDAVVTPTRPAKVSVRATSPGASWNTPANTVTVTGDSGQYPNDLHVTNPAAIAGGADAHSAFVIQQSDWDAARSVLTARVTDALDVALKAKAVQMSYIANGPPMLTVFSAHKVGDMVPSFTMTVTGTIAATAFSDAEARALLRSALEAKVPSDQQLTSDAIQITWQILQTGANGDITVLGKAVGFVAPRLATDTLRARIRGLSPADARKSLERAVPGSSVEIRISPVAVLWLPLFAQHISMTVVVQPAGP
jgi:Baseplate J-like protein